ncbi:MAG: protein translocase subunit secF/protein translocase subunit secD [Armatimonadetes bacterium]|nr:protein translocase subunit secF/protein translocase subunit secD [Armatimonadota bacterium]
MTLIAVLALVAGAIWYSLAPQFPVALGLDLRGGMRVTLEPDYPKLEGQQIDRETMQLVRSVLENRVNSFGLSGTEVRLKGEDQILILLPGAKRPEEALKTLSTVALMEFRHLRNVQSDRNPDARYRMTHTPGDAEKGEPDQYRFFDTATDQAVPSAQVVADAELLLKGNALKPNSRAEINPNDGQPFVSFELKPEGAKVFGDFTTDGVGEILAIVLDQQIISAPNIDEPITEGQGQISGGFKTMAEARVLANLLNSGALPIPLVPAETQTVGATLGQESVESSIRAGIAGLGIVLLFMLGYYWLPGVVACLALIAYATLTFSIFKGLGVFPPIVLDLPGITGFILSIGMAVDGNVLIFERLKEELRSGKSLNVATEAGFRRAFTAIIDSNITVWIICGVLIWLGTPMVKGFAITLAIGNAVAMFTAITVTRSFLHLFTQMEWARNPRLYAIHNSWLNLFFPAWRHGGVMRIFDRRRLYLGLSAALAVLSVGFIALTPFGFGLKPGIDFTGGSVVEVAFRDPGVTREQVVEVLKSHGVDEATVRIGHSEQPWTRVTVEASDVDKLTADRVPELLSEAEGLNSFDPAAYEASTSDKPFSAKAVYTSAVTEAQVRGALGGLGLKGLKVAAVAEPHQDHARVPVAEVVTKQLPPTKLQEVRDALRKVGGGTIEPMSRVTSIGPSIAAEVTRNGIFSAVVASLAMLLFLAVRFAIGGFANGVKFGVGALIALFHDVLLTVGFFAVMGWLAGWPVDSLFLTACLGLLGFSVNDTIVIYDRLRENLGRRRKGETFPEVSDRSMTESFDRSVNTSVAVMLALAAMVVFGGETLRLFNIALLFGMAVGTYSSVFVATPLVVLLERAAGPTEAPPRAAPAPGTPLPRPRQELVPAAVERQTPEGKETTEIELTEPETDAAGGLAQPGVIRPVRRRRQ